MREVGHADKAVNDRYTHPLGQAHLAAAERQRHWCGKTGQRHERDECSHNVLTRGWSSEVTTCRVTAPMQVRLRGAGELKPTTGRL
jgi:hypothetical protein